MKKVLAVTALLIASIQPSLAKESLELMRCEGDSCSKSYDVIRIGALYSHLKEGNDYKTNGGGLFLNAENLSDDLSFEPHIEYATYQKKNGVRAYRHKEEFNLKFGIPLGTDSVSLRPSIGVGHELTGLKGQDNTKLRHMYGRIGADLRITANENFHITPSIAYVKDVYTRLKYDGDSYTHGGHAFEYGLTNDFTIGNHGFTTGIYAQNYKNSHIGENSLKRYDVRLGYKF